MTKLELVSNLLAGLSTLTLSTIGPGGSPRATPLFYIAGEEFRLYWLSSASSEHSRNLKRNPAAAVAMCRDTARWKQLCGIQMRGQAFPVTDRSRRKEILAAYVKRFQLGADLDGVIARSRLYEFRPAWLRYIDNSRRFGYKFEWSL